MKWPLKKISLIVLALYVVVSCYTAYLLIARRLQPSQHENGVGDTLPVLKKNDDKDWNPWGLEFDNVGKKRDDVDRSREELIDWQRDFGMGKEGNDENSEGQHVVEIWGKAAIGMYLWEHIIGGETESRLGGVWSYGAKQIGNIMFRFRTGPGVVPTKVPQHVENLVLVLNGREKSKVDFARMWLDYLPNFKKLRRVALVLLGNEQCENDWIKSYMTLTGGMVNLVFLVYDSPEIDDVTFYQWPLGVATYRNFPHVNASTLPMRDFRPFQCNFLGTVYKNTSREIMLRLIRDHSLTQACYINPRLHWLPLETDASIDEYIRALSNSELTLSPVGQNSECYRIYEAMSYGSVPVIEDQRTPGKCANSAHRLLKEYNAPVIWIKQWDELPDILRHEKSLTLEDLVKRRITMIQWYEEFKRKVRNKFTSVIERQFFGGAD